MQFLHQIYLILLVGIATLTNVHGITATSHLCMLPHSVDGYKQPVVWRCHGQLPLWSYDQHRNECVEFRYGGCGGNDNSFYTQEDCEATCRGSY